MNVRLLSALAGLLAGVGVLLLALAATLVLEDVLERVRVYRLSPVVHRFRRGREERSAATLYGAPDLPWNHLAVGLGVLGVAGLWPLVGFPLALGGLILGGLPLLARRMARAEGETRLRLAVRDFVDDLREAVVLYGSLGPALDALVAMRGQDGDPLSRALLRHTRLRTQEMSADRVLQEMARDLGNEDLAEVAAQVRLALDAGMALDAALAHVAGVLSERIHADVQKRLAAAPNTYIIPMVATVFGPLFFLVIVPLMMSVLRALKF